MYGNNGGSNPEYRESGRSNGNQYGNSTSQRNDSQGGNDLTSKYENMMMRDEREGCSPKSRKTYMESKAQHSDKAMQMKELENYMQELTSDMLEMVEGSTQEEKQYLSKRIAALANKTQQLND